MVKTEKVEYLMLNETTVDVETVSKNMKITNESVVDGPEGSKLYTVSYDTVLSEFGRKNWNGRTYIKDRFMKDIANNALFQNDLKNNGGVPSEYGHPLIDNKDRSSMSRQLSFDPTMVCAMLKKYWDEGNLLKGSFTTVVGGWGSVLRDRILTGIPAMVSSRSVGGVDSQGNVLPGAILVCFDHVFRMSSQDARQIPGTLKVNSYTLPSAVAQNVVQAGPGQTMSESAVPIDIMSDSFKDFLLSESVSRDKISVVCDTMKLDYDSMVLTENSLQISKIEGNERTTVYMPLNKLVGANSYRLF